MLLTLALPLVLAFIMFALGLGLQVRDFTRVASMPKAFGVGMLNQLVLLPLIAFALILVFGLRLELAVGFMILAAAPGGPTSNMLTSLAKGNVALSVSMTAIASLLSMLTLPLILGLSYPYFMEAASPDVSAVSISVSMFLIAVVPVLLGMIVRGVAPRLATRLDRPVSIIAVVLFALIVIAALALNWSTFTANALTLGPALVLLNLIMLALGVITGSLLGVSKRDQTAICIESGVQNGTLAIAIAGFFATSGEVLSAYAIPAAGYAIVMYAISVPFVLWRRRLTD